MAFRRRHVPEVDVRGRRFDGAPTGESPPPTPTVREASARLGPHLDLGETVLAVVVGGVEAGGVHLALTTRGIWLADQVWKPLHQVPNYEVASVDVAQGGFVIEAAGSRLPVRVWDEAASAAFVEAYHGLQELLEDPEGD